MCRAVLIWGPVNYSIVSTWEGNSCLSVWAFTFRNEIQVSFIQFLFRPCTPKDESRGAMVASLFEGLKTEGDLFSPPYLTLLPPHMQRISVSCADQTCVSASRLLRDAQGATNLSSGSGAGVFPISLLPNGTHSTITHRTPSTSFLKAPGCAR